MAAALVAAVALFIALPRVAAPVIGAVSSVVTLDAGGVERAPAISVGHDRAYELLTTSQRVLYDQLTAGFSAEMEAFATDAGSGEDLQAAYDAVLSDHPELFWIDGCSYAMHPDCTVVEPKCKYSAAEIDDKRRRVDEVVDQVIALIPQEASTYERLLFAYEWVIDNTEYRLEAPENQSIESVFLGGESVCAGYSRAFQHLCHKLGIPCGLITGVCSSQQTEDTHAWNIVEIDGTLTYIDVTWGDPTFEGEESGRMSHDYFCVTSEEIGRDHEALDPPAELLPECNSHEYDYFRRSGTYLEAFSPEALDDIIGRAMDKGVSSVTFKLSNTDECSRAHEYVNSEEVFNGRLGDMRETSFSLNEAIYIIELSWE